MTYGRADQEYERLQLRIRAWERWLAQLRAWRVDADAAFAEHSRRLQHTVNEIVALKAAIAARGQQHGPVGPVPSTASLAEQQHYASLEGEQGAERRSWQRWRDAARIAEHDAAGFDTSWSPRDPGDLSRLENEALWRIGVLTQERDALEAVQVAALPAPDYVAYRERMGR